jgi:hypothetical protein
MSSLVRLVEKQDTGLVSQRFGNQDTTLHAAGQGHDAIVFLVPERQRSQRLLDVGGIRRFAEQAAAETDGRPYGLEGIGRELLRHETDQRSRGPERPDVVVPVHGHRARRGVHDAADDVDQRGLAGAVRTQQRQYFPVPYVEIDLV